MQKDYIENYEEWHEESEITSEAFTVFRQIMVYLRMMKKSFRKVFSGVQ